MSVRVQTWFPYEIQIALNGREWLRRGLERQGVAHTADGNKFLSVGDFGAAQKILDSQPLASWFGLLDGFAREAFPTMGQTLGGGPGYRWTLWQSEWATDLIFDSPGSVAPLMDSLLRHELANGTGERVLRYFGKPVRPDGQPHPLADPDILSRLNVWYNGGFGLEHTFCANEQASKNCHLMMQAAFILWQLLAKGALQRLTRACRKVTDVKLAELLRTSLLLVPVTDGAPSFGQLRFSSA